MPFQAVLAPFAARFDALGRAYRGLLASDALMVLSIMVGQVALPWWIAREGGAGDLARYGFVVSLASVAAMPLLSPLGDRHEKRRLIMLALAAFAVAAFGMAALATFGHYRIGLLVTLAMVPVMASAIITPASASFATELVPAEQLTQAIGLQQSAQSTGRLVGPALGGAVLAAAGVPAALWLHGLLLVAAAGLARGLPASPPQARGRGHWWRDLRAGFRANWNIPMERGWIAVNFSTWVFLYPMFTMLVPLKVQSLHLSAMWLGLCEASLSLGMLAGALGACDPMIRRYGRYAVRVGAAVLQGLAFASIAFVEQAPLLVAAFWVAGITNSAMVLVGMTHRMLARPAAFRARMVAGAVMTTQVAAAIGAAMAGAALTHWSVDVVYAVFGVVAGVLSATLAWVPGFREFMALEPSAVAGWYERRYPGVFGAP